MAQIVSGVGTAICVFTKPPVPEETKTRLIPAVGAQGAAELAEAFLRDALEMLGKLTWAETLIAATQPFSRPYIGNHQLWIQPEGSLDIRLETILRRALRQYEMAFAFGADTPGLPAGCIEQAREELYSHDVVLGPSSDGGFYLIGLKQCPAGLLSGIEWSKPVTMEQTLCRLRERGLSIAVIREWFDVDGPADLPRLESLVASGSIECRHTRSVLEKLNRIRAAPVTK